jgi:trehalose 6-phosphate synthase
VLWPILHYRIDLAEFTRRDLTGYLRVVLPSDLLWVHDYHFIPLGEELRKRGHTNRIGFFLHVPFPAPEFITVLPHHERFPRLQARDRCIDQRLIDPNALTCSAIGSCSL